MRFGGPMSKRTQRRKRMLVAKKPIMGGNLIWAEIPDH
ncbi:MAG: hypothetical protein Ct9H90mP5_01640 [Acidimicrobiaceae bacterium]|nr:MAG: hypothetical protein Ct9H90mP5_01640 [Acidimicrobiaceae bacterium]